MSLDAGMDALRRFGRKAFAKTKEIYTEARKAAGLPAGGPVTESNPRYYVVVADQGAMVREGADMESAQVQGLRKGDVVTVVELLGRRARISDPFEGWVSLETSTGEKIFRQTVPLDKRRQVEAMERRFDRLKTNQQDGEQNSISPMSGSMSVTPSKPSNRAAQGAETPTSQLEPNSPTVTGFNQGTGAVLNLKNKIKIKDNSMPGSSGNVVTTTDLLIGEETSHVSSVFVPKLPAPPGSQKPSPQPTNFTAIDL